MSKVQKATNVGAWAAVILAVLGLIGQWLERDQARIEREKAKERLTRVTAVEAVTNDTAYRTLVERLNELAKDVHECRVSTAVHERELDRLHARHRLARKPDTLGVVPASRPVTLPVLREKPAPNDPRVEVAQEALKGAL